MNITSYLELMIEKNASDIFFSPGAMISMKIDGTNVPCGDAPLTPEQSYEIAYSFMSQSQMQIFEQTMELNIAISLKGIGRFRANVFRQRGEVSIVIRHIHASIKTIEELGLPLILKDLVMERSGLILVVGAAGTGKSTTLAAMIDHRNTHATGHILTVEDPVEYLYSHKKSIINQREVGVDTLSYQNALRNVLREAPDAILIGEIRDPETMQHAMNYSQTGHLCLSTLHANSTNLALERITKFYPESSRKHVLLDLALNMRAIISQRLIPSVDGKRVAAVELLLNTPYISALIEKGEISAIKEAMTRQPERGMQTFDQALFTLYTKGVISQENALRYADSDNDLGLKIRLSKNDLQGKENDLSIMRD